MNLSKDRPIDRRSFLKLGLVCAAALAIPLPCYAQLKQAALRERALSFYNTHTGEELKKTVFWADGHYMPDALEEINYLLRDFRCNEVSNIDPRLCDTLFALRKKLDTERPIHIISGYRSPQTNQQLRRQSKGVAKNSLHLVGRAIDLRIPELRLANVRKAALSLQSGGVGYYPGSDFIHIDTGPLRQW